MGALEERKEETLDHIDVFLWDGAWRTVKAVMCRTQPAGGAVSMAIHALLSLWYVSELSQRTWKWSH